MTAAALTPRTLGICAGIGAAAFIGYCFYFDNRRRSAPDFKKKLREKRRNAAKKAAANKGPALPDFSDKEAVQNFFFQEIQLGEELLAQGDIENGVEHLSLAVAVCGQPHSLLGVLQQTIPPQIYQLLLQNLDIAQSRIRAHVTSNVGGLMRGGPPPGMAGMGGPMGMAGMGGPMGGGPAVGGPAAAEGKGLDEEDVE